MVVELRELLHESSSHPPHDDGDVAALLHAGRRRVRARRAKLLGGTALAAVAFSALAVSGAGPTNREADRPGGPVLRLSDATPAVEGQDYRVLASLTKDDVLRADGRIIVGVTDDGMVVLQDGMTRQRFALMDPATGAKDWLPEPEREDGQTWMLADLGEDRLVLITSDVQPASDGSSLDTRALVFDRGTRSWAYTSWEDLQPVYRPEYIAAVHDDRVYVAVRAAGSGPDESPLHLWSASLTDGTDVRDEGVEVGAAGDETQIGALAFTEDEMVWTDPSLGDPQEVHVRDLDTGEEHSFTTPSAEGCELLAMGAADDRIVLSQRCGAHDNSTDSDDRVQVLTTQGDLVTTIRDDAVVGTISGGPEGPALVTLTSFGEDGEGTYVYDLASERFLRITDSVSPQPVGGGQTPSRQFVWHTPVEGGDGNGATQWVGELLD